MAGLHGGCGHFFAGLFFASRFLLRCFFASPFKWLRRFAVRGAGIACGGFACGAWPPAAGASGGRSVGYFIEGTG